MSSTSAVQNKKVNLAQVKSKSHSKLHSKLHSKADVKAQNVTASSGVNATASANSTTPANAETCTNGEGVDSYGDSCTWYDANPSGCGSYDTASWTSAAACCACGGGAGGESEVEATPAGDSGCADDMTVVDSFGDSCTWYDSNPSGCGSYDTSTFVADDACVACGACDDGADSTDSTGSGDSCTNGSGVDSFGDSCTWYDANPSGCGNYDTGSWTSAAACCACGGSDEIQASAPVATSDDSCTNGGGVDSYGDSCTWYDSNPSGCGNYDTGSWTSAAACCACGGSEEIYAATPVAATPVANLDDSCTNGSGVDSFGDSCTWYDANPSGCGNYDTASWTSAAACCACGGSADGDATPAPSGDGGCANDMTVVDSFGDSCTWYDSNPSGCGSYDTSSFVAANACVACGSCEVGAEEAPVTSNPACAIDEAVNAMGPNQCYSSSECAGDRYCQASGWCGGESNC